MENDLSTYQWIVRICLFIFAAIGLFGGSMQMIPGQPDTTPRLDNVHRVPRQRLWARFSSGLREGFCSS